MKIILTAHFDSLYRVYTLIVKASSHSDSLYQLFTLTAKAYTKTLLKDGDRPDISV